MSLLSDADRTSLVFPGVKVGTLGMPVSGDVQNALVRAVIDVHLHLPDMFELTFVDTDGDLVTNASLAIGADIELTGAEAGDTTSSTSLIKGEVTALEAVCADGMLFTVVRGYDKSNRLQRAKRSRTFVNMKDSDIAEQIARDAGLQTGTVTGSKAVHTQMAQIAETDWDFLMRRAQEIGYEMGMEDGKFYFRTASDSASSAGGLGGLAGAVAGALGLGSTLTFKDNLHTFLPRISGANLTPSVEVRVWDPKQARVVVATASTSSKTADVDTTPVKLAGDFSNGFLSLPSLPSLPSIPGLPKLDFGSQPNNKAFVVTNLPLGVGSAAQSAADEVAKALADEVASSFAEAEGLASGDPNIKAGTQIDIKGVPAPFVGKWTVTNARHIFDAEEGGYLTRFWVSGRTNRSLYGLASGGRAGAGPSFEGLVCGIVTNVSDPDKQGKVKVTLPWLAPDFETDWARVVNAASGGRTGALFLPEPGDEVLVGFEFGDGRRPYVLGGLTNDNAKFSTLSKAVSGGSVVGRGIETPAGNLLMFADEVPPGPGEMPPTKSSITLGTGDGNLGLVIDQVAGTITITCKPAPPKSKAAAGTVTIDCSGAGKVEIKAGAGGMKIDSEGQLELNGKLGVKIASSANVQVQGQMIQLN